jgi:hypothetical protein
MMTDTKLTEGEFNLLTLLAKQKPGVGVPWSILSGVQNGHGTRLSKRGLTHWVGKGSVKKLHITASGRAALEEPWK